MEDFLRLENNIIELIKEQQIKLGYRSESVHLYYPMASLNRLMKKQWDEQQMAKKLNEFCSQVEKKLGKLKITKNGDRFCFIVPPQGADYVHKNLSKQDFLVHFIHTISKQNCSLKDILAVFFEYSDQVQIEKMTNEEFDYLVYFEDGKPNDYRYCITVEEHHILYHRFTIEDYNDFGFSIGEKLDSKQQKELMG
ncbi:DUF based on E. rectale Gene description [Clostridiales bacterium CHKCI001]|nr:DUF based on E. rectale Gene description [Clostridiales bacterium CHKCI001]